MNRVINTLYNADRTIASWFGARPQETISSAVGRIARGDARGHTRFEEWAALWLAHRLDTDKWIWGPEHTEKAIEHADKLDKVDDGNEQ